MSALLSLIPLRAWFVGFGIVAVLGACLMFVHRIEQSTLEHQAAIEAQVAQEKTDAATKADDAARLCSADPTCRMRPDQYLRK